MLYQKKYILTLHSLYNQTGYFTICSSQILIKLVSHTLHHSCCFLYLPLTSQASLTPRTCFIHEPLPCPSWCGASCIVSTRERLCQKKAKHRPGSDTVSSVMWKFRLPNLDVIWINYHFAKIQHH